MPLRKRKKAQKMLRDGISNAALFVKQGGLVAFPTETVYGLGGDALNPSTVEKIYAAKGRPADNPLIVHIARADDFWQLNLGAPDYVKHLIQEFWPGPLTLVAAKNPDLPKWVGVHPSKEADTIAIRMPSHPVALELITLSGCFIAAPSANKSGRPSPTASEHVTHDFPEDLNIIVLEAGPTTVGLESTVLDITGETPIILRPGFVTQEEIEHTAQRRAKYKVAAKNNTPRSPGTKYKHYAPRAPLTILVGSHANIAGFLTQETKNPGLGALVTPITYDLLPEYVLTDASIICSGSAADVFAKNLYADFRKFDSLKEVNRIFAECMPFEGIGVAIMDRMDKAAEGRIVIV